jgi:hypothetical protein
MRAREPDSTPISSRPQPFWLLTRPTSFPFIWSEGTSIPGAGSLGGSDGQEHLRSIQLEIQTIHILPKGVFVAVLPTFVFNLNRDFNIFSLGLGAGRALNRRLLIQGGYVHHIAGRETFNRALQINQGCPQAKACGSDRVASTNQSRGL